MLPMPNRPDLNGAALGGLQLHIQRLSLPDIPVIDRIAFSGGEAKYDEPGMAIETVNRYVVTADITESDLCAFVRTKMPDRMRLRDLRVSPTGIKFTAEAVIIVPIPIRLMLRLEVVDGNELRIVADDVNVLGAGPKNLVQSQLQQLNPLLRTSDLPVPVQFDSVEHTDAKVIIKGSVGTRISLQEFTS